MSNDSAGNPFASVLKDALALSKQVQASQEADAEQEPLVAERAEGLIRVTAGAGGEIGVLLDPKAMRLGSEVLAAELAGAVNEALTAYKERQGILQNLDLEAVNQQIEELQEQASSQLNNFMDGILRAHQAAGETGPEKE
jgi:DNA-binding protein YbaB